MAGADGIAITVVIAVVVPLLSAAAAFGGMRAGARAQTARQAEAEKRMEARQLELEKKLDSAFEKITAKMDVIVEKLAIVAVLESRVAKLEEELRTLRAHGHDVANKVQIALIHVDELRRAKENA